MPFASRVLLSAVLALLPLASVPFPAAAAQRHAPSAVQNRPGLSGFSGLAATPRGKAPSASHTASPAISPRSGSANFVYDGGFEPETITPQWTQLTNGARQLVDTTHPHSGNYSADLCQSTNSCHALAHQ